MPLGREYAGQNCTLARALEVVGERWTMLILRDLFFGVRRFGAIKAHLDIPSAALSDRLANARRLRPGRAHPVRGDARRVPAHPARARAVADPVPADAVGRAALRRRRRRGPDLLPRRVRHGALRGRELRHVRDDPCARTRSRRARAPPRRAWSARTRSASRCGRRTGCWSRCRDRLPDPARFGLGELSPQPRGVAHLGLEVGQRDARGCVRASRAAVRARRCRARAGSAP